MDWAKTTATQYDKLLGFGIRSDLYLRFEVTKITKASVTYSWITHGISIGYIYIYILCVCIFCVYHTLCVALLCTFYQVAIWCAFLGCAFHQLTRYAVFECVDEAGKHRNQYYQHIINACMIAEFVKKYSNVIDNELSSSYILMERFCQAN